MRAGLSGGAAAAVPLRAEEPPECLPAAADLPPAEEARAPVAPARERSGGEIGSGVSAESPRAVEDVGPALRAAPRGLLFRPAGGRRGRRALRHRHDDRGSGRRCALFLLRQHLSRVDEALRGDPRQNGGIGEFPVGDEDGGREIPLVVRDGGAVHQLRLDDQGISRREPQRIVDSQRLRELLDGRLLAAFPLLEHAEMKVRERETRFPVNRAAERRDRARSLALLLPQEPFVVRRQVRGAVEPLREPILPGRLLREPAAGEEIPQVVVNCWILRLFRRLAGQLSNLAITRVFVRQVLVVEGRGRLSPGWAAGFASPGEAA